MYQRSQSVSQPYKCHSDAALAGFLAALDRAYLKTYVQKNTGVIYVLAFWMLLQLRCFAAILICDIDLEGTGLHCLCSAYRQDASAAQKVDTLSHP